MLGEFGRGATPLNATSFCDPSTVPFETGLSVSITNITRQESTLKIHPNPISQNKVLTLELTSKGASKAQASIFNALGQEVMFGQTLELVDGLNKHRSFTNRSDVCWKSCGNILMPAFLKLYKS